MASVFSWQNFISLWPTSFCTSRPNLSVTPGIYWLPTFAFQSPIMKRTSFLCVSSRKSCSSSWNCSASASSAFLLRALLWYWMVCLGNTFFNIMKRSYTTRAGGKVMAKGLSEMLEKWGTLGTVMANIQSLCWVQVPLLLSPSSSSPLQSQCSIKPF